MLLLLQSIVRRRSNAAIPRSGGYVDFLRLTPWMLLVGHIASAALQAAQLVEDKIHIKLIQ